ncbi:MAG: hypothetical protein L3V56_14240 [Candidatus Magnetoovum sp. WYHC-5]|nr:hypothetical protein [Candidatus Magnetoovum sp. WYHC-5]
MDRKVYLETTAIIDLIFKKNQTLKKIIDEFDLVYTSQYVKMEINKGFLNYLVLIYNRLVGAECLSDVISYLGNLNIHRKYHLGAAIEIFKEYIKAVEKKRPSELRFYNRDTTLDEPPLSQLLLNDIRDYCCMRIKLFLKNIDAIEYEILNPMECVEINKPSLKNGLFKKRTIGCKKAENKCNIRDFFEHNKDYFDVISAKLVCPSSSAIDKETEKRIRALKEILQEILPYNKPFNNHEAHKLCLSCSDAIHCVVAPQQASVISKNARHFQPICEAINKKFETYSS